MMNLPNQVQMVTKFNCEKCRFSTKDPHKYKNHVSLHNDIKFSCSHCDYVSYTKGDFQRHLVTHTGKFPYTCEYCGYGAVRNDYIVKHIKRIHGDGKIQCSVSSAINGAKSVNIVQTPLPSNTSHGCSNNTINTTEQVDLTNNVGNVTSLLPTFDSNVSNASVNGSQVEVEVISPSEGPLYPWMTLTVVAPKTFKVPSSCFAQIAQVNPVNGTYHLTLKCFEQRDLRLKNEDGPNKEALLKEHKWPDDMLTSEEHADHSSLCSLQEGSALQISASKLPSNEEQMSVTDGPVTKSKQNLLGALPKENNDNISHVAEGPFISSVFSLSSGSKNILEGIQWENCPNDSNESILPKKSIETIGAAHISVNPPGNQALPSTATTTCISKLEKGNDELFDKIKKQTSIVLENADFGLTVKEKSLDAELVPTPDGGKTCKDRTSALMQDHKKRWDKPNRYNKKDMHFCSQPQTLFLSCNKNVVMQPLTCVMQNGFKNGLKLPELKTNPTDTFSEQENITDNSSDNIVTKGNVHRATNACLPGNQSSKVTRKQSFHKANCLKPKDKALSRRQGTFASKRTLPQSSRPLRLLPFKACQLTQTPSYNQPVVVLNHPDMDSLETRHIMKILNKFKSNIIKVTLSEKMCNTYA
ncbi:zinc finger protein 518B [Spea bombifrons]|uniref:zinc finger protein 518B n=1 Tax=Spea bombifrons TaxID=233779 RepID=UPI00234B5293|nr:zinc finger protein 518B [Spea bombifrons]